MAALFTPEELAELARIDAELEAEPMTNEEICESRKRDKAALNDRKRKKERKIAESQRAYYEANREKIAESQRAYREANREKIAESQRAYREANREKIAETQRAYREANREKIAEIQRAYREANREKIAESQRAYYEANPEKHEAHKAYMREYARRRYQERRAKA